MRPETTDSSLANVTSMHPADRTYRNQTVRLADLTVVSSEIREVVFENCTIDGPAVLAMFGCEMTNSSLEGDLDATLWVVPAEREQVVGVVAMVNCRIYGCRLTRIGIAVPEAEVEVYRQGFSG